MDEPADIRERATSPVHVLAVCAGLVMGTILLYARVGRFDFISYDDHQYVLNNPNLKDGLSVRAIGWAFTTGERANWHPVTWMSYLIDVSIFGIRPGPMHVVNMLIHSANAVLVLLLLLQLTGRLWPSAWVAAMFAWHPLHVESVAWIAERKDVLCAFFMLLSLIVYVQYARVPSRWGYAGVISLLILALLSKPMAVTTPCIMLLLDVWPLKRIAKGIGIRRLLLEKLPLFGVVLISSIVTFMVQSAGQSVASVDAIPLASRITNALVAYAAYLWKTIAPYGLAIFYPHHATYPAGRLGVMVIAGSVLILAAISIIAWIGRRRMPWLLIGWLWYVGMLVPVIGIVQVGKQSMADRYTYLPLIGVFVAVAWTVGEWGRSSAKSIRGAIGTLAGVSLVVMAGLTWGQIGTWRDTETVMRHAVRVVPNNYVAHASLADALNDKGDLAGALREYETALKIRPDDPVALYSLAKYSVKQGNIPAAIDYYERAIKSDPSQPAASNNLGILYNQLGRTDDSIRAYRSALAGDSTLDLAHFNLGNVLIRQGKIDEGLEHWRQAVRLRPSFGEAHFALGQLLLARGQSQDGASHLKQAAATLPRRVDVLNRLAWTLATWSDASIHDGPEAVRIAAAACELTRNSDATSLDVLGAALARAGQFEQAVQAAQAALAVAESQRNATFVRAIQGRIGLYRAGQPYAESR